MKLVDLKCPNCGQYFTVDEDMKECTCEYCGSKMLIDNEVQASVITNAKQAGYEAERGRQEALEEYEREKEEKRREEAEKRRLEFEKEQEEKRLREKEKQRKNNIVMSVRSFLLVVFTSIWMHDMSYRFAILNADTISLFTYTGQSKKIWLWILRFDLTYDFEQNCADSGHVFDLLLFFVLPFVLLFALLSAWKNKRWIMVIGYIISLVIMVAFFVIRYDWYMNGIY